MKLLQIAFIVVLGVTCLATYITSETLQLARAGAEQSARLALQDT